MFDTREKIALFIDGANLYAASRALAFDIDYKKLLVAFQCRGGVACTVAWNLLPVDSPRFEKLVNFGDVY